MITFHSFSNLELINIIAAKEIPDPWYNSLTMAIFTQDWCPDWMQMLPWIEELRSMSKKGNLCTGVYNITSCSEEFQFFKEEQWNNGLIPYIRLYKDGGLVRETNHLTREEFFSFFSAG